MVFLVGIVVAAVEGASRQRNRQFLGQSKKTWETAVADDVPENPVCRLALIMVNGESGDVGPEVAILLRKQGETKMYIYEDIYKLFFGHVSYALHARWVAFAESIVCPSPARVEIYC